ncbi:MAG TPA: hypothetical protein VFU63_09750 [Ktedonobacterales bacterium]|nr:hypothetical protein [Ktedonobacterales bacterium]
MAQTKERTQPEAKSSPKKAQRASAPASSARQSNSPAPRSTWRSWLRPPLTNAPGPDGKPRQRLGGTIFKSFFGILIWFVASQFIMYGLLVLDSALTKPGGKPPLQTTYLLPPNTPLLGWITPFLILYGGAVIGLWFLLIRFKLIPRDFFGARAQAEARARRQAGSSTTAGASTGPHKTRAQRRRAEVQAQSNAKNNGKGSAKGGGKPAAKATDSQKDVSAATGTHDDEYDRVRAAERLRRRRESKR